MRPEDILLYVRAQPFRPFRIVMNSGRVFDIRHPEMIRVGRTSMHIFTFAGEVADPYEKVELVSALLVERLEHLDVPARTQG